MYEVFQEGHTNLNISATRAGKLKSRKSSKIHIKIYNYFSCFARKFTKVELTS